MPRHRPTYASLDRIQHIDAAIRRGARVNCATVARRFEIERHAILADVRYMEDRLGWPIKFDRRRNTYYYTEPVAPLSTMATTEGEVFALLIASASMQQYRGTHFGPQTAAAYRKLAAQLPGLVSFPRGRDAFSFKTFGTPKLDPAVFKILFRSCWRGREVHFDYRSAGDTAVKRRRVQPWHFAFRGHLGYLIGYDHAAGRPITFALPRIFRPVLTKVHFTVPEDFSPGQFFRKAFSVLGGDGDHRVVIRFKGASADRVRECEWHESETQRELPGGRLELAMQLGALEEVASWIFSWGADAEVVGPKALRDLVAKTAIAVAKQYR